MLKNKRGQFESVLVAIVTLFIIGILLFFMNHLNNELYGSLDKYFNNSERYANSTAHTTVRDIQEVDNAIWDFAFLAIFVGFIIQMVLLSFATRVSLAFYWIFAIVGIVALLVGTILSNIWQEFAANPEFAVTITRFPITNTILGTYYPIFITGLLLIVIIAIFGKPPGSQTEGLAV